MTAFVGIQGDAGTGKTTVLRAVKAIAEQQGIKLLGLGPTKNAGMMLAEKAGIPSMTVHKFLLLKKPVLASVWIVDESSMVNTQQMDMLMKHAIQQNAKVVFVGGHQTIAGNSCGETL